MNKVIIRNSCIIINDYNLDKFKTLIIEDSIHAIKGAKLKDLNVLTIKTKINFKEYEIIRKYSDYFIGV